MNVLLRNLAIYLLDDDEGISEEAYVALRICMEDDDPEGYKDILDCVDGCNGRLFISHEDAKKLLGY